MAEIRVAAHQLRIADILIPDDGGPARRVTGCRLQGASPTVVVQFAGADHTTIYAATAPLTIYRAPTDPEDPHDHKHSPPATTALGRRLLPG